MPRSTSRWRSWAAGATATTRCARSSRPSSSGTTWSSPRSEDLSVECEGLDVRPEEELSYRAALLLQDGPLPLARGPLSGSARASPWPRAWAEAAPTPLRRCRPCAASGTLTCRRRLCTVWQPSLAPTYLSSSGAARPWPPGGATSSQPCPLCRRRGWCSCPRPPPSRRRPPHSTPGCARSTTATAAASTLWPTLCVRARPCERSGWSTPSKHVADDVYPGHAARRQALAAAVGGTAHLSGAGPSLYALVAGMAEGEQACTRLRAQGLQPQLVRSMTPP